MIFRQRKHLIAGCKKPDYDNSVSISPIVPYAKVTNRQHPIN